MRADALNTADPSTYCAVCGAPATAWSEDLLVLCHVVTGEEEVVTLCRGAWCREHSRPGSVTYQEWGLSFPSTFFDDPEECIHD